MKLSWTSLLSIFFSCYIAYSMYTFSSLFRKLECSDKTLGKCYQNFLNSKPKMQLALFTSHTTSPLVADVVKLANIRNFDYSESYSK